MLVDLTELAKFPRSSLNEDGQVVKYLEHEGIEEIPPKAHRYVTYTCFSFSGEVIRSQKNILINMETLALENPGFYLALASMKKEERAWFRINMSYLDEMTKKNQSSAKGFWYKVYLEDYKVRLQDSLNIEQRIALFNQYKLRAQNCFHNGEYQIAVKYYTTCANLYTGLPKKLGLSEQKRAQLKKDSKTCLRNSVVAVIKGQLESEYEKARSSIKGLLQEDRGPKNLYLYGRLLMLMRYMSDAKEVLLQSYSLQALPETQKLIQSIRDHLQPEKVYKYVLENLEAERVRESKTKKKEIKQQWLEAADQEQNKQLVLEKMIHNETLDLHDLSILP